MNNSESWILSYFVNSLWQAPLLLAAGVLAACALRSAGPEAEHRVWVGVLLFECVLPACSPAQFFWLRSLLDWGFGTRSSADSEVTVLMGVGSATAAFHFSSAVLAVVALTYGAVTMYFVARIVWRWSRLDALRRDSVRMHLAGDSARCWEHCSERFAVRNAWLASSSKIFAPVTIGISRKLLLVPDGIVSRVSETEMGSVIAHEFAHMRRNDFLKNLVYELLSLPVSYHPALWFTRAKVTESREIVCDELAAELAGRIQYSRSLLRLASLLIESESAKPAHALGMFDSNILERRLMKLAETQIEIRGMRRFAALAAALTLGAATCASALALHLQVNSAGATSHHGLTHSSKPVTVKPSIMEKQIISKVIPRYPVEAKKARIQGVVVLSATIDKQGNVQNLQVESGPVQLRQSSLDAVRQWKYKPYLLNGEPVDIKTTVNISYTLAKKKQ